MPAPDEQIEFTTMDGRSHQVRAWPEQCRAAYTTMPCLVGWASKGPATQTRVGAQAIAAARESCDSRPVHRLLASIARQRAADPRTPAFMRAGWERLADRYDARLERGRPEPSKAEVQNARDEMLVAADLIREGRRRSVFAMNPLLLALADFYHAEAIERGDKLAEVHWRRRREFYEARRYM